MEAERLDIKEVRKKFTEAETAEMDNRYLALDDIQNVNGEQWPVTVRSDREADGRPCLVLNRLPGFIDQVVGDQRQNRSRIHVSPVDSSSDPDIARILEGIIRNIENISSAENVYDWSFEQAVTSGWGYMRVLKRYVDAETFNQELIISKIKNQFCVYFDPQSEEYDGSDARHCFITEVMSKDDFNSKFPKAEIPDNFEGNSTGSIYEGWFLNDKVRIAEYWEKRPVNQTIVLLDDGTVMPKDEYNKLDYNVSKIVRERIAVKYEVYQYIISGHEVLDGPNKWDDDTIPIIPVWGKELIVDGKRVLRGLIRWAKEPQKLYNYWQSVITETIALQPKAPYLVTADQVLGYEEIWRNSSKKSYPYLPYNPTGDAIPQRQFPASMPGGAFSSAHVAIDDMKATTGLYDASLGSRSNEISGAAINARQREGDTSTFAFPDNLAKSIKRVGRILVNMIPKTYDTERILRIIGLDGESQLIEVNKSALNQGQPVIINDLSVGKYDVVVETGPSYSTQRQEAVSSMMSFMQALPQQAALIADLAAKNMNWQDSDEISRRLKNSLPPNILKEKGQENPQSSPEVMMEMQKMQMEQDKMRMDMEKTKLKYEIDIQKLQLEYAKVELEKAKVIVQ